MQALQLSEQMKLRHLEMENQNLKKQYEDEMMKNNNLMIKVKSIEASQAFAEKYVYMLVVVYSFVLFFCISKHAKNLLFINILGFLKIV